MNEEFRAATDAGRRFQALLAAFEAHQHHSALGAEAIPVADMGDDFRVPPDPYPGLRSFTPQEGGVFFGRERNVNEIRERLADLNFAVVLGGSGSGKSSLIRAGLIPRLNSTKGISGRCGNWYAAEFRPRLQPMNEMTRTLENVITEHFSDQLESGSKTDEADVVTWLRHAFGSKANGALPADRSAEAEALSAALLDFVDNKLDQLDRTASHGLRSGKPSLLLVVDQFEEVFRPEVAAGPHAGGRKLLDTLIATCTKLAHMRKAGKQSGLFVVITMRSEELHRCAEHPALTIELGEKSVAHSLADIVNGGVYLLDLLDPEHDRNDLREAIVRPARRVFSDWGLPLDIENPDAPYAEGVVEWLLSGAERLSHELEHRPDQLPLLQHALQTIWRGAIEDWTTVESPTGYEIRKAHLRCHAHEGGVVCPEPDLAACLDLRADLTARQGVERFARALLSSGLTREPREYASKAGQTVIRGAFRALAQHDDRGNWARRFADTHLIEAFLVSDVKSRKFSSEQYAQGIHTALSSFVSRGYLVLKDGYYDISHEALIRNWKQYQEWLRDPQEISHALIRAVADLDPGRLSGESPDAKDDLLGNLSPSLCYTLERTLEKGELPQMWIVEQILPLVNRPDVAKRWGTANPAKVVAVLGSLVSRAQSIRTQRASARARKERNRWLAIAAVVVTGLASAVLFTGWRGYEAAQTARITRAKLIALNAEVALDHEGPAHALLVAMQAKKAGLSDILETEQVIYRSLRQLREKRAFPMAGVTSAAASPNGDVLAGITSGGAVHFWRSSDGAYIDSYALTTTGPAQTFGLQWSPDGNRLAIGVGDRVAIVTPCSHANLRSLFASCTGRSEQDRISSLGTAAIQAATGKFSRDGKLLITGGWRARARIWDIDSGENTDLGAETAFPWAVALAPNMQIAAVGTGQGTIRVVNRTTGEASMLKLPDNNNPGAIMSLEFGKEPDVLLASTQSGQVWIWNLATGTPTLVVGQHGQAFQAAFSSDGKRIATASGDGVLRVWPLKEISELPFVLRGHAGPVYSVQFTPDGETLVSASPDDNTIRTWSVASALRANIGHTSIALPADDVPGSAAAQNDRPPGGTEIRATNAQGYTVIAYNGAKKHLALFGPKSTTTPVTQWGDRIPVTWRSVEFRKQDPSGKDDGPVAIVATSTTGETFSWPHFKDLDALTEFAKGQIPFYGQKKLELPDNELCKLDLMEKTKCTTGDGN